MDKASCLRWKYRKSVSVLLYFHFIFVLYSTLLLIGRCLQVSRLVRRPFFFLASLAILCAICDSSRKFKENSPLISFLHITRSSRKRKPKNWYYLGAIRWLVQNWRFVFQKIFRSPIYSSYLWSLLQTIKFCAPIVYERKELNNMSTEPFSSMTGRCYRIFKRIKWRTNDACSNVVSHSRVIFCKRKWGLWASHRRWDYL